jgi:hypothetical protein
MLKKVLVGLVIVVAFLFAFVASRPSSFVVERSAVIAAPPAVVFARLADFGQWSAWSPWEKLDPAMKRSISGAPATVGHSYAWSGNAKAGEGRMTITELTPERIDVRLEFLKPWKATNETVFTLAPEGSGCRVTWTMSGTSGFAMKAMGLVTNMDAMVGKDFEQGLRNLRATAEADVGHASR